MSANKKIPTDGGSSLGQNPFASLANAGLSSRGQTAGASEVPPKVTPLPGPRHGPSSPTAPPVASAPPAVPAKNRGRVDIRRQTAGRGGKTVTVVEGFIGIGLPEKEALAKRMQKACGCGGTVKEGRIEVQGDKREQVARILAEAGFRPVFAGG